jgi:hypothetical protein
MTVNLFRILALLLVLLFAVAAISLFVAVTNAGASTEYHTYLTMVFKACVPPQLPCLDVVSS